MGSTDARGKACVAWGRTQSRLREREGKDHIVCADRGSFASLVMWGAVRWKPHLSARAGDGIRGKKIRRTAIRKLYCSGDVNIEQIKLL
jgi:hypothetical protein